MLGLAVLATLYDPEKYTSEFIPRMIELTRHKNVRLPSSQILNYDILVLIQLQCIWSSLIPLSLLCGGLIVGFLPAGDRLSMQKGGPLITTSCMMIAKLYTSPGRVP